MESFAWWFSTFVKKLKYCTITFHGEVGVAFETVGNILGMIAKDRRLCLLYLVAPALVGGDTHQPPTKVHSSFDLVCTSIVSNRQDR